MHSYNENLQSTFLKMLKCIFVMFSIWQTSTWQTGVPGGKQERMKSHGLKDAAPYWGFPQCSPLTYYLSDSLIYLYPNQRRYFNLILTGCRKLTNCASETHKLKFRNKKVRKLCFATKMALVSQIEALVIQKEAHMP